MAAPVHVYDVFIRATPERVWAALVEPVDTERYFHHVRYESTFEAGAPYRQLLPDGSVAVEGVVEEIDPPRRLVITWRTLYDPALASEPPSRVEWTLAPASDAGDVTRVTLRHLDLGRSPGTWARVRLGWVGILDSLKSLLETGEPLPTVDVGEPASVTDSEGAWHRTAAIEANNSAWELLDGRELSVDELADLLGRAHAAAYHWARAAGAAPANAARADWLLSRAYAVAHEPGLALCFADRCMMTVAVHHLDDFDRAFAHEARARALACAGRLEEAAVERADAAAVPIADDEDRAVFLADLASSPWFGLEEVS